MSLQDIITTKEVSFGKHSTWRRNGSKIFIRTKKNDEELPDDYVNKLSCKKIIFESDKGIVLITFEVEGWK